MGRAPCCSKVGLHRGPWTPLEDSLLTKYIQAHGEGQWRSMPKKAGLLRCGKSCRLRWLNYLRPDIKRGNITPEEDDLIIRLHALLGNRWSLIAGRLPGRTDNEIKNYWNTHLSKKLWSQGTDLNTHKKLPERLPVPPKKKRSNTNGIKRKLSTKSGNDGIVVLKEKPKVHIPKPFRVTSVTSVKRNNSLATIESDDTNVSASTVEGSGGDAMHGEALGTTYWPSDQNVPPCDGMDMMMGSEGDDVVGLVLQEQGVTVQPRASDLDKLYEEYFQLLKTDDDRDYLDDDQARELDSFAESLLV